MNIHYFNIVTEIARTVGYGESSPTSWLMENGALFLEYSRKHEAQVTGKTTLAQINNTSRQQIANNNSNGTFNSAQCLTSEKLRTRLQRFYPRLSTSVFIAFPTGSDDAWKNPLITLEFSRTFIFVGKVAKFDAKAGDQRPGNH
ncbi:hypothetical protein AVEN_211879-1 [Araneus ventricosus]|uniref:Uncharacterized protein n=1 Tax=Araneus ventricosus TaxID=182803 RepID=A0A4Y2EYL3_ARAVE|nr:hypothetical protein AVEN_211879-1 [Araneus ventricosus]